MQIETILLILLGIGLMVIAGRVRRAASRRAARERRSGPSTAQEIQGAPPQAAPGPPAERREARSA